VEKECDSWKMNGGGEPLSASQMVAAAGTNDVNNEDMFINVVIDGGRE
jgi:hypothetical protein